MPWYFSYKSFRSNWLFSLLSPRGAATPSIFFCLSFISESLRRCRGFTWKQQKNSFFFFCSFFMYSCRKVLIGFLRLGSGNHPLGFGIHPSGSLSHHSASRFHHSLLGIHHSGSGTCPFESITWNSGSMTGNSESAALLHSYTYGELNGGNSTHATSSS